MTTYDVIAKHAHGKYWELHIDGVGVTQARGLAEAKEMAVDYICTALDVSAEAVVVTIMPDLGDTLTEEAESARMLLAFAEVSTRKAAQQSRLAVSHMKEAGLRQVDIATFLGLSPQRVSQLAKGR